MNEKIKDLIWEWDNGTISPYDFIKKLKDLINVDKKNVSFVSVLVKPNDEILEKIKDLNFDYYQLYDVDPERTKEIKLKYKKKIITAISVSTKHDVIKYKNYSEKGFFFHPI